MDRSRWQELAEAILTRMQGIRIAEGYQTNLGGSVHQWRAISLAEAETDALSIRDYPTAPADEQTFGAHQHRLRVRFEVIAVGNDAATNLRAYTADIMQAIGEDPTWGGLAEATEPGEMGEPMLEQNERKVLSVAFDIILHFSTDRWSAYA